MRLARIWVAHRLTAIALLYLATSGLAWAATTPPGGVPDEPSHMIYAAAVVRGDLGEPTEVNDPLFDRLMGVEVPKWTTTASLCFRFQPAVTADCQPGMTDHQQEVLATTTATKYPPLYYALVGTPTLLVAGAPALYAVRVISVLLGVVIIGLALTVATPVRRWWLTVGVLIAFTPTVAHFVGSVNPQGMEIVIALALGVSLLGLVHEGESQRRVWFQAITIGVLAFIFAWARPWSSGIMIAVAVVAAVANWSSIRRWAEANAFPASVVGGAILLGVVTALLFEFQVRDPAEATVVSHYALFSHPFTQNLNTVLELAGTWLLSEVGQFGWLDHGPPQIVQFVWLAFLATFTIWAMVLSGRLMRVVVLASLAGAVLLAPMFIIEFVFGSVEGYQARYSLPVLVLVPVLALFALGSRGVASSETITVTKAASWFAGLAPLMMLVSVLWSVARYSIGAPFGWTDVVGGRFITAASWLPPGEALVVSSVSLVALILLAVALWARVRQGPNASESRIARSTQEP